jgi:hypothetical protein
MLPPGPSTVPQTRPARSTGRKRVSTGPWVGRAACRLSTRPRHPGRHAAALTRSRWCCTASACWSLRAVPHRRGGLDAAPHGPPPHGVTPLPKGLRPMLATAGTCRRRRGLGVRGEVGRRAGARSPSTAAADRHLAQRQRRDVVLPGARRRWGGSSARRRSCSTARWCLDAAGPDGLRPACSRGCTSPGPVRLCAGTRPCSCCSFDVLHLDGRSLLDRSYDDRRAALDGPRAAGRALVGPAGLPRRRRGGARGDRAQGLEGVVAKRRSAPYLPGRRSDDWRKLKHVHRTSAWSAGWKPGEGGRAGGSARCCSASTGRPGWSSPATSAPASPRRRSRCSAGGSSRCAGDLAVRHAGAAGARPHRRVGRARGGGRGGVHRVDARRAAAAPVVQGAARRRARRGGRRDGE